MKNHLKSSLLAVFCMVGIASSQTASANIDGGYLQCLKQCEKMRDDNLAAALERYSDGHALATSCYLWQPLPGVYPMPTRIYDVWRKKLSNQCNVDLYFVWADYDSCVSDCDAAVQLESR